MSTHVFVYTYIITRWGSARLDEEDGAQPDSMNKMGPSPNPGKAIPVFFSVSNIKMGCSPMMLTPGPPLSHLVSKYVLPKCFSIFALVLALIHDRVTSQQPSIGTAGTMCIVNWLINTLLRDLPMICFAFSRSQKCYGQVMSRHFKSKSLYQLVFDWH